MTPIDYASPHTKPASVRLSVAWLWLISTAVPLTAISWLIVIKGAADEPYYGGISKFDATSQVGVGTALIVLWALWSAMVITFILRRCLHPAVSAILIWAAICVFYLGRGVNGYLSDITAWTSGAARAAPASPAPPATRPTTQADAPR
jgi:hypothetical protein